MTEQAIKEGCINILRIQHDDWCATLKTGSGQDCNCNPVTRMVPLETDEEIEAYCNEEL